MDTSRQVIRWTIPGTVFVLVAFGVRGVTCRLMECGSVDLEPAMVALLVGSVLPLGFALYQLYFFGYHRAQWWRMPLDRGQRVLCHLRANVPDGFSAMLDRCGWDAENLQPAPTRQRSFPLIGTVHYLPEDQRSREAVRRYRRRGVSNMAALNTIIDAIADGASPSRERIREEYVTLSDVYHAQGASRSATLWASVAAAASTFPPLAAAVDSYSQWAWTNAVASTPAVWLYVVLNEARRHTLTRLIETMKYSLASALSRE